MFCYQERQRKEKGQDLVLTVPQAKGSKPCHKTPSPSIPRKNTPLAEDNHKHVEEPK